MKNIFFSHCLGLFLLGGLWVPGVVLAEQESQILLDVEGRLEEGDIALSDGGLLDVYEIEITTTSPIFISAESDEFDTFLGILDSQGEKVAENDDFDGSNAGILLEKVKPGKYEIGVRNYKTGEIGQYRLLVKIPTPSELISLKANSLFNQARSLQVRGSAESLLKAIDYFENSVSLYVQLDDSLKVGIILNTIGLIYSNLGDKRKALDYYDQAFTINKKIGNLSGEGTTLNNIASVYSHLGDNQKALDYYNQALIIRKQIEDLSGEGTTLNNIGLIYSSLGNKQEALDYYNQAPKYRTKVVWGRTLSEGEKGKER